MEIHNLTSGEWAVYGLLTIITLLINGTVTGVVLKRFWDKRDLKKKTSDERDGKAIDADIRATEMFVGRIEKLEAALEKLQAEQLSQMESKARIESDYRHLETENKRLNKEVDELRRKAHQLSTDIMHRDAKISELSTALQSLTERFNRANPAKT
jgi:predicted RNase H-like nuclease (RuvC/YqgF family)